MNISIVCDYASIYSGNFIPSVFYFADSIKKNNNVIFLFPNEAKDREWLKKIKDEGFDVLLFSRKKKEFIADIRLASKKTKPDLVYYHFVSPALGKIPFLFKKTRLCFHIHSDFDGGKKPSVFVSLKNNFFDFFIKRKSIYFYVSTDLMSKSKAKIKYHIPNGLVKYKFCTSCNDAKLSTISKLEEPVFLAFAWSPYVKGIDVLCKAFNKFSQSHKSTLLLVYRKDGGKKELTSFLESNGISLQNITMLPPVENVNYYYSKCNCFVSSSRSEGFSYSVLEAISLDKTVIISDIPGTVWANEFNYVISFKTENVDSLVEAMEKATYLEHSKNENKKNSKLLQNYSIEKWFKDINFAFTERGLKL